MTKVLKIYNDTDAILRVKCREVEIIEPWVLSLCDDMWTTMKAKNGIGIAANQVGYDYRVIAVDGPQFSGIMINPIIHERSEEIFHFVEGCLSVPGIGFDPGIRSRSISVSYSDVSGEKKKLWTQDITSVIIQHEVDHLDGKMFTDYIDKRIR